MKKKLDPTSEEVFETLATYYKLAEGGDEGLSHQPTAFRTAMVVRLEAAIDHGAPEDSVYRDEADSFREELSVEERIPRLVGIVTAMIRELPSGNQSGPSDDTARLYRTLKQICPPAHAVLLSVRRHGRMKDGLAARADVDSCRNAVENLFKTLGGKEKWVEGLDSAVKDASLNKLARDIYAYLSTNGTHAKVLDQTPADAVLALHLTESLTVRVLAKLGKW